MTRDKFDSRLKKKCIVTTFEKFVFAIIINLITKPIRSVPIIVKIVRFRKKK